MSSNSDTDQPGADKKPPEVPPLRGPDGRVVDLPKDPVTGKLLPCYITNAGVAVLDENGRTVALKFSQDGNPIPLDKAYPHLAGQMGTGQSTGQPQPQGGYGPGSYGPQQSDGGGCCCCGGKQEEYNSYGGAGGNQVITQQPRADTSGIYTNAQYTPPPPNTNTAAAPAAAYAQQPAVVMAGYPTVPVYSPMMGYGYPYMGGYGMGGYGMGMGMMGGPMYGYGMMNSFW